MFLQSVTTRVAVFITVLIIGVTGIAYAAGHLLDTPLLMAYVGQYAISHETTFAYFLDPERGLGIPLLKPAGIEILTRGHRPELEIFYVSENIRNQEDGGSTKILYRYNFRTNEMKPVYESRTATEYVGGPIPFELIPSADGRYYAFADNYQQVVVVINSSTLETNIVWRREPIGSINDAPFIQWSPDNDRIAIYDQANGPSITVVDIAGNRLSNFSVVEVINPSLNWINQYDVLLSSRSRLEDRPIRAYNTVSGELNSHTRMLSGRFATRLPSCQEHDQWVQFVQEDKPAVFHVFTKNLTTGEQVRHDSVSYEELEIGGALLKSSSNCSVFVQLASIRGSGPIYTSDIYLTTLDASTARKVADEAIVGYRGPEDTLLYAKPNEDGSYSLYRLYLDGTDRIELLQHDVPTRDAVQYPRLVESGWYVFQNNEWVRRQSIVPSVPGNPLVYYDIKTGKARLLTPPGANISYSIELP